ncbi:MAG: asparagine synthase (glutamine-hydrolyzing) [Pseudanabaena frigida]|uniref:asparagine synthase (glutamine-hydrolyzing) n=1 Tax=Pseudanabaena frigida TaxID=945775 RepID=A0A2W4XTC6_9CYAN|nr:MAG: asparagine synthase (glutamine-hydrolyzing) [Pseudanabaena frigida]
MCGIIGIISKDLITVNNFYKLLTVIKSRGPDDCGEWHDDRVYLGHTRLSILDLSSLGHQPMSYQNERYWITFNGEIYNYLEIRQELIDLGYLFDSKTDTEVLLAAYAQWGKNCLEKLRGMFAFAIWDTQSKQLFLARDRIGEKPLYYWYDRDKFYFASELKALVKMLPHQPKLDPISIDLFLHYQYVPEPRTPLAGVYKLTAAHYLLIDYQTWEIQPQPYWSLSQIPPISGDPIELIRQELDRVIELTLRSDVAVGVALSGGIDSGAIAALAAPKYKDTLQCFSIGYPNRPPYDERKQAEELAKSLGLPFADIELKTEALVDFFPDLVSAMDDPIADIAAFGHYSVMKLASDRGIKVMMSGIGGDELFWGYAWTIEAVQLTQRKQQILQGQIKPRFGLDLISKFANHRLYRKFAYSHKSPQALRSLLSQGIEHSLLDLQHPEQAVYQNLVGNFQLALQYSKQLYTDEFAALIPYRNAFRPYEMHSQNIDEIPQQICQILFDTWLVSNCLALGDRVSMASSVETRLPFLDYKLIELVMGLRQTQPDQELGLKYWLKQSLKGTIPDEVLNRPKQGFQPPVQEWMEGILDRYINYLIDGHLLELQVIDASYLNKICQEFTNKREHTFMLYKLLLLEIWYRKVVMSELL